MAALTAKKPPRCTGSTVFVGFFLLPCPFFIWRQLNFEYKNGKVIAVRQRPKIKSRQNQHKIKTELNQFQRHLFGGFF